MQGWGGVGGSCRVGLGVGHVGYGWGWVSCRGGWGGVCHIGVRLGGSCRVSRGCV